MSYTHGNNMKQTVILAGVLLMMPSHSDALSCSLNENIYFCHREEIVCICMFCLLCVFFF